MVSAQGTVSRSILSFFTKMVHMQESTPNLNKNLDELTILLNSSQRLAIFTGAGISTESGIPDFRSPGGIWTKMAPIQFQDFLDNEEMRHESWRRKFEVDKTIKRARPNEGHYAVAELVNSKKATSVITQNIDNLHQESGIAPEQVIELHGNGTYAKCLNCGAREELDVIKQTFLGRGELPVCKSCGGHIKTATISFGQAMPEEPVRRAHEEALKCDLFLVIGSSLVVYPAADIPMIAKRNGAKLVILNREPTPVDNYADLVISEEIGEILPLAIKTN